MQPSQTLSEQFIPQYLTEFDDRYARANLPIDPAFIQGVEIAAAAIAAGFLGKMGSDLYDKLKSEVLKRISEKYKKSDPPRVIVIEGEDRDKTVLNFGRVRPCFRIGKGNVLVLRNITIAYEGSPQGMIKEEVAPSFFPINVIFKQVKP